MKLCIIGTGYVGLVSAACFAEMGNTVTCVDVNPDVVARLRAGQVHIYEPGLEEMVKASHADGRLSFTTELANDNAEGGWAYIEQFRFGAVSEGDFWYSDPMAEWPLELTDENGQAFRAEAGEYELTLDKENMKLYIKKVGQTLKRGDVNGDGTVNITDVTILINAVMSEDFTNIYLSNADVDDSGNHNITDVTLLITSVMGN